MNLLLVTFVIVIKGFFFFNVVVYLRILHPFFFPCIVGEEDAGWEGWDDLRTEMIYEQ